MVKFIIEVSEDYINEHADLDKVKEIAKSSNGKSALVSMLTCLTFSGVKKRVEEGETEFVISKEGLEEKASEIYDHAVDVISSLVVIGSK